MRVMTVGEFHGLGFYIASFGGKVCLFLTGQPVMALPGKMLMEDVCRLASLLLMKWRKESAKWDKVCKELFDKVTRWQRWFGISDGNFMVDVEELDYLKIDEILNGLEKKYGIQLEMKGIAGKEK